MDNSPVPSRRAVLAAAAATISLPLLESTLNSLRAARAAAPGTAPATQASGWVATTLKPADLKDGEFTAVAGKKFMLSRADKTVSAMTTACTHQGVNMAPKAGDKIITCPRHGSQFNLDGSVAHGPARNPLPRYALRVNDKGLIEVDPSKAIAKDAKEATLTIA